MWGWVKPFLEWLASYLERRARESRTIADAKTPDTIRSRWDTWLRERLRDKDGGD